MRGCDHIEVGNVQPKGQPVQFFSGVFYLFAGRTLWRGFVHSGMEGLTDANPVWAEEMGLSFMTHRTTGR